MRSIAKDQFLFSLLKAAVSSAVLLAAAPLSAQSFAAQQARVEVMASTSLNSEQRQQFDRFSNEPSYFGAFYVSSNGGSAWHRDVNTLDAARVLAQHDCESGGSRCSLYAVMVPDAPAGRTSFDKLAMSQAPGIMQWIRARRGSSNGSAIAASPYWGYYATIRGNGVRAAERDALRDCRQDLNQRINDWLDPDQIGALQAAGLLECQIIVSVRER
ncbi:MAG: hypothetical protein AAFU41_16415 [Pseudomonadota bacterium]